MTTRYVSTDGPNSANSGPGTMESPWKTLSYAAANVQPGDKVKIAPGVYYERLLINTNDTTWEHDGSSGVVYIDGRYDPESVFAANIKRIDPPDKPGTNWVLKGWGDIFKAMVDINADNVVLDGKSRYGIVVRNACGQGVDLAIGKSNIVVRHVRTDFTYNGGWRVQANDSLMQNCCCSRSGMQYYDPTRLTNIPGAGPAAVPSAVMFLDGNGSTADGNEVFCNFGEGIVAGKRSTNVTLKRNISHTNGHVHMYVNFSRGAVVYENLIYNDFTCLEFNETASSDGLVFGDETAGDPSAYVSKYGARNPQIYNNVVVGCGRSFALRWSTGPNYKTVVDGLYLGHNTFLASDKAETRKQVFYIGGADAPKRALIENNIIEVAPGSGVEISSWGSTLSGKNLVVRNNVWRESPVPGARGVGDVYADPMLNNNRPSIPPVNFVRNAPELTPVALTDTDFFALLPGSPAIGAASDGSTVVGITPPINKPDCGASFSFSMPTDPTPEQPDEPAQEHSIVVEFNAYQRQVEVGTPVEFGNLTYVEGDGEHPPISYLWNFGDETPPSAEENPIHTYLAAGDYTVTLTATVGEASASHMHTHYIQVVPVPEPEPPLAQAVVDVLAERQVQIDEWLAAGSQSTINDWIAIASDYAADALPPGAGSDTVRGSMVKAAAVLLAALNAFDTDSIEPRYYDPVA